MAETKYSDVTDAGLRALLLERNGKIEAHEQRFGGKSVTDYTADEVTEFQALQKEINELSEKIDAPLAMWKANERNRRY